MRPIKIVLSLVMGGFILLVGCFGLYFFTTYDYWVAAIYGDWDDFIELDPDDPLAYSLRGLEYGRAGDHERAIADFSKAIELEPDYAGFYSSHQISNRLRMLYICNYP